MLDETRFLTPPRWRLAVLALCFAAVAFFPFAAGADDIDDLRREVEELKQQVLFLQNQMPIGGAGASGAGGNLAAQQEVRRQEMERQIAELTGQIERVEIKLNDLAAQVERMQKDVEYRMSVIEGGGTSMAAGAAGTMPPVSEPETAGVFAEAGAPTDLSADTGQAAPASAPISPPTQSGASAPQSAVIVPPSQPGVLGTLTAEQAANLPQAPPGAAEEAAATAAATVPAPSALATEPPKSRAPVAPISLPGTTPREKYDFATGLLQQGNYDMAEAALKTFVIQYPGDALAGNAQYWLGETFYVRNDFRSAAVAFAEGYQKYPQNQKAPDNLLKLAMSLGQQGQTQNACVALRQLKKRFPDAPANIKDRAQRAGERFSCN